MKRSMFRSIGRVAVGIVCVAAFAAAPSGCILFRGRCCACCQKAEGKKCPPGCTKPCCQKVEGNKCPPGCTKPCCKKA